MTKQIKVAHISMIVTSILAATLLAVQPAHAGNIEPGPRGRARTVSHSGNIEPGPR
jgi:hypothetical protein